MVIILVISREKSTRSTVKVADHRVILRKNNEDEWAQLIF